MYQTDRVIVLRGQASLQQGPYSVGAVLARELGAAVYQAHRGLNVGAVLARDMSGAVYQEDRVIVHRGQAPLPQGAAGRQEDLVIVYRERCGQATARCQNRAIAEGRDYRKSRMSRSSLRPTKIEIDSRITENATRMPIESISGPCPPIRAER